MEISELVSSEREKKKLTQSELARRSGVSRSYIIQIEQGKRGKRISPKILIQIANTLGVSVKPFLDALGLSYEEPDFPALNRLQKPVRVPIYKEFPFHAGSPVRPVDYFFYSGLGPTPKNIEGYIVHGDCLSPTIQEGDVIIVDREGSIDNGDIVACLIDDELQLAKLRKVAGELWLENNYSKYRFQECLVAAPVIEINRRIKR